jgi:topoisomerase-4 subunit A
VILSQKGWIRAAKGHDFDFDSLNYRAGDSFLEAVKCRSTQPVYLLDSTGRAYSITTHDLPSARSQGEPLTGRLNPPPRALFAHLLAGHPDDWYLVASNYGYGFRVQLKELYSKNKAGKVLLTLSEGAKVVKPAELRSNNDRLAVVTQQGRLLIFPAQELPELVKGKGNKLIQIPPDDLAAGKDAVVAVAALPENGQLKIIAGKRQLTLKEGDIAQYAGARAKRGLHLPRGFQRVDALEAE